MKSIEYTEKIIKALSQDREQDHEMILAFSQFVRSSAHTAMEQIFKDAMDWDPRVAPLIINRVIALLYHSHFQMTIEPIEKDSSDEISGQETD